MNGAVTAALFYSYQPVRYGRQPSDPGDHVEAGLSHSRRLACSIEYTFGDKTGKVIDSSVGKELVPGLEKELTGLKDRRSKKIVVKPEEDGYRADPNAFQEIPKTSSRLRCKR
jgi:hypothetical protein